ncbi:insulin-like growth factor-binding protein 7 [Polypterus senegalus]|uniref:insulin-like growth factor-binding protein 7 n=1 Tax=Polypterus senegalus TaxID=55291 RepID=UPI0019664E3B|nr:insulin-like growth factor-binding protein 7 [Polypterus senegalus]
MLQPSLLPLCLLLVVPCIALAPARPVRGCPPCNPSGCAPLPREGCAWAAVTDVCGCCSVCAAGEREPCGGRGGGGSGGRCAPGMECVKKSKRQAGQCVCKNDGEVCGSDGKTYGSSCQLRAAGAAVRQVRKGACDQAPRITIPPKDIWNISGAQVYLSCEVIGVPTPLLTWKKVVTSGHRREKVELLPGDRDNLAVQTRGGPEKHEVTGWVLISPLGQEEGGEYECHAANAKGEAVAMATIHVVESLKDIPTPSLGETETS